MLGVMLIALIGFSAVTVALIWGIMWAADRWLHLYAAMGVGIDAILYLVQNIARGIAYCNEDPVYVPPSPSEGGEGQIIANCDSAGGIVDRVYLYMVGPAAVLCLGVIMVRIWRRSRALSAAEVTS
jgi:hypothetical protein